MTGFEKLRARMLADPALKSDSERLGPIYEVVGALIDARHEAGLTQVQLAERMGTRQSVIARLETARRLPSLDLVTRYAATTGRRIALVRAD